MNYILITGGLYVAGMIIEAKLKSQKENSKPAQVNDYIRDDVAPYYNGRFDPDHGASDASQMGVYLGEQEYLWGPNPDAEHVFFDPVNHYCYQPTPIPSARLYSLVPSSS